VYLSFVTSYQVGTKNLARTQGRKTLLIPYLYHLINAEAHVKPLPKAAKQTMLPSCSFPSAQASLRAMGMEPAVVFP
jgi:hypothetical protein